MVSVATETEKVVQEFTTGGEMFTAWDVTRILRNRLPSENIKHPSVKTEVYRLFDTDEMGIYGREQVNVGSKVSPFVYHMPHLDPDDYDPSWLDAQIGASKTVAVSSVTATPSTASTPATSHSSSVGSRPSRKTVKITAEGRINVPTNMLGNFGSLAYLSITKAQCGGSTVKALEISSTPTSSDLRSYKVNADGRVRISTRYLNRSIGIAQTYSVIPAGNTIVIVAN